MWREKKNCIKFWLNTMFCGVRFGSHVCHIIFLRHLFCLVMVCVLYCSSLLFFCTYLYMVQYVWHTKCFVCNYNLYFFARFYCATVHVTCIACDAVVAAIKSYKADYRVLGLLVDKKKIGFICIECGIKLKLAAAKGGGVFFFLK